MAADPQRGATLFATPPAAGLLACADCHGAEPQVNNFGNIWAGRNAVMLIQRAVQANTGGMGVFARYYNSADLADIAAYLGNAPAALVFDATEVGSDSAPRSVTVASSTKIGIGALLLRTEGDFVIAGGSCGASVPRFSTCAVDVVFRPGAAGERSGSLLIAHDGTPTPVRIALSGTASARPAAIARLEPERLHFFAAGPPGVQSATVLNDSAERLTLAGIVPGSAAFRVVGGSCRPGLTLLPGRRCEVALRFDPASGGAVAETSTLTIGHDGVGGSSVLALSGSADIGAPARLEADLPVVDFGSLPAGGRAAPQTVTWHNAGNADWHWQATTVTAPGVAVLADGCRSAGRVVPGQACAVALGFDAPRVGASGGRLVLQGSGGVPPAQLPVSARVTDGASVLAATPAGLSISGTVGQAVRRQLRLMALGDAKLSLAGIDLAGADAARFALAGGGCRVGTVLAPATGCTLALDFTPARAGVHQAVLRVQAAGSAAATDIPLAGFGDSAQAPSGLQIDASRLDFGEQAPGAAALSRRRISVYNAGPAPWLAAAITTTGADAAAFSLGGNCAIGQPLEVGAHCTLDIDFTPSATGVRQATMLLQGADSGAPVLVSLFGRAVAAGLPRLQADTAWLQWPPLRPGATAMRQVSFSNQGSAPAAAPRWATDGPFRIGRVGPGCDAPLAPGARCTLDLLFEPTAAGAASGRLRWGAAGSVALLGEALDAATPQLAWQSTPPAPSHGTATVGGAPLLSSFLTLVNRGDAATGPLALGLAGAHASDFSLDDAGSCRAGTVLASRQSCSLRIHFHPSAAGPRSASLRLQGGVAFADLPLAGQGRAEARGLLQAQPRALWFDAPQTADVPAGLFWHNGGPAALRVASIRLRGDGFGLRDGGCPAPPFILQPGQGCVSALVWNGGAEARFGADLVARFDDGMSLALPLAVVENPALRSNVGGSGGGGMGLASVLALALAALALRRAESRDG